MEALFSAATARLVKPPPPTLPRCDSCGLYKHCKSPKIKVSGQGRRGILIIGERPGKDEDEAGEAFVGRSGQYLERTLDRCHISMRMDCWLTNAAICYPTGELPDSAVADCRPNVLRNIRDLNPQVILLLGQAAVKSVVGHVWQNDVGKMLRWAGHQIPNHKPNAWLCPSYNPAFLIRRDSDPTLEPRFFEHIRAATRLQSRPWPDGPPNYPAQVELVHSPDAAAKRIGRYSRGVVAFDFETDRLKPDHADARIECCSVCWEGQETIAFPWHGAAVDAMLELLQNPDVGKIAQNCKFEHRWCLARLGIEVVGWVFDTMLAAHALDPRGQQSGLDFAAFVKMGVPDWSAHISPMLESVEAGGNSPNRIREVGLDHLLRYCGVDSLLEFKLAEIQAKELGVPLGQ